MNTVHIHFYFHFQLTRSGRQLFELLCYTKIVSNMQYILSYLNLMIWLIVLVHHDCKAPVVEIKFSLVSPVRPATCRTLNKRSPWRSGDSINLSTRPGRWRRSWSESTSPRGPEPTVLTPTSDCVFYFGRHRSLCRNSWAAAWFRKGKCERSFRRSPLLCCSACSRDVRTSRCLQSGRTACSEETVHLGQLTHSACTWRRV